MPIYIAPYYNSEGPQIAVGKYSNALASANATSIEKTVATMKSDWAELRPEAMYVVAIRLFDLGRKDEAVYWFYSAQYRARLFDALRTPQEAEAIGGRAFELSNAYSAFFLLVGSHINLYAFDNPKMLANTLERVQSEGQILPDFKKLYPDIVFVADSRWSTMHEQVDSGLTELRSTVEEHAAAFPNGVPKDAANSKPGEMNARRVWPDPQAAALATAAQNGNVSEIDRLVAAGVNVNEEGLGDVTPLYWVLRTRNKAGYKRLLEHGASPNIETADGESVMHFAAVRYDPEWLDLALQNGGDPNLPCSRCRRCPNRTPIFGAIGMERAEAIQLLIKAGANVNQMDHENQAPLEYAIRLGRYEYAYQLLQAGADFSVETSQGKDITALIKEAGSKGRPRPQQRWIDKCLEFLERHAKDNPVEEEQER